MRVIAWSLLGLLVRSVVPMSVPKGFNQLRRCEPSKGQVMIASIVAVVVHCGLIMLSLSQSQHCCFQGAGLVLGLQARPWSSHWRPRSERGIGRLTDPLGHGSEFTELNCSSTSVVDWMSGLSRWDVQRGLKFRLPTVSDTEFQFSIHSTWQVF